MLICMLENILSAPHISCNFSFKKIHRTGIFQYKYLSINVENIEKCVIIEVIRNFTRSTPRKKNVIYKLGCQTYLSAKMMWVPMAIALFAHMEEEALGVSDCLTPRQLNDCSDILSSSRHT